MAKARVERERAQLTRMSGIIDANKVIPNRRILRVQPQLDYEQRHKEGKSEAVSGSLRLRRSARFPLCPKTTVIRLRTKGFVLQ